MATGSMPQFLDRLRFSDDKAFTGTIINPKAYRVTAELYQTGACFAVELRRPLDGKSTSIA